MPTLKFDRVVSCNSEDPSFPASNLLESESYKKWKCKAAGEEQAVVILQLEKPSHITGIDIGNEGSAFVEVLVGRQSSDEFKVLLLASSFMTPMEAKNGTNKNRVRMFSKDQLCKPVVDEKWDRVKVVCRQPFNRYQQYGLCFITFHSPEGHMLGRFELKNEDDVGSYKAGCLFARRKEQPREGEPLKGAAAIRAASRPEALLQKPEPKKNKVLEDVKQKRDTPPPQAHCSSDKPKTPKTVDFPRKKSPSPQRPSALGKPKKPTDSPAPVVKLNNKPSPPNKAKKPKTDDHNLKNGMKRSLSSDRESVKKMKVEDKRVLRKPFSKLLEGVVFVISGYQNPERSNVRSMALEMGAKYKPDWDNSCTHLVCAFMNTPKYQQVHGKGYIVRKEWIEQCYTRHARIPWRRQALDRKEQNKPESEDEILEEVSESPVHSPADSDIEPEMGSGSDTEEEIERIQTAVVNSTLDSDTTPDSDTDVEEPEKPPDTDSLPFPPLPNALVNMSFYLRPEDHKHRKLIMRHIIANGGSILTSEAENVDYIVSDESPDIVKEELEQWPKATVVDYSWVLDKLKLKLKD